MKKGTHVDSIGFLLGSICKVRRNTANEMLAQYGIHAGQDILLYYLNQEDGKTVSQLLEDICVQPATISNTINRMVANNLIKKVKDENDMRVSRIFLTEKGKEVFSEVKDVWNILEVQTVEGLTDEEKQVLKKLLLRLLSNFDNHNGQLFRK